jgi:hypothetical protein
LKFFIRVLGLQVTEVMWLLPKFLLIGKELGSQL